MPYKKDTKIKCRKCGWSWQKSKGGLDPYKCHKCDYNNKNMYGKNIIGLGGVKTSYFSLTRKGEKKTSKTMAVGKTIRIRFLTRDRRIKETKSKWTKEQLDGLKRLYVIKPISYIDFLTVNN